jgi:hypothetical protein
LYTPASRQQLTAATVFVTAKRLPSDPQSDKFELGDCRVSCRYRTEGGDVVSLQILGCANAIRTGRLQSADKEEAVAQVLRTNAEIGIVGPDKAAERLAKDLATEFGGVIISPTHAELVG